MAWSSRWWMAIVAVGLTGGCGLSRPPRDSAVPPRTSAPVLQSCYPAWEQSDLAVASHTRLPVQTTTVFANLGNGPQLTAATLTAWLGQPRGTPFTAQKLLQGWSVQGDVGIGARGRLRLIPAGNGPVAYGTPGVNMVLSEYRPTRRQTALLHSSKLGGPLTLVVQISGAHPPHTLAGAMRSLVDEVQGGHGTALTVATQTTGPGPARYQSYAGPIAPQALARATKPCPRGNAGWVLGVRHRLIVATRAVFASNANGIRLGFAPGCFILDNNHAGYDTVQWFREPRISVPPT